MILISYNLPNPYYLLGYRKTIVWTINNFKIRFSTACATWLSLIWSENH